MLIRRFLFLSLLFFILLFSCEIKNGSSRDDSTRQTDSTNYEDPSEILPEKEDSLLHSIRVKRVLEDIKETRGLYLSAYTVETAEFPSILDSLVMAGLNTVVFDLKNMRGEVFFSTRQKRSLANENIQSIIDLPGMIRRLHGLNLKAVSRIVMFHDQHWATNDVTVRPKTLTGDPWVESERRGPSWLDPSHPRVKNYLLALIEEVTRTGIDEIQLDYIRFPTQGDIGNSKYYYQEEDSLLFAEDSTYIFRNREDIITDFVYRAKSICEKSGVSLTADVFAIVSWQREADIKSTGQNIRRLSEHLDAIHPMIYSSHFSENFGFRSDVHNEPFYLVYRAAKLTRLFCVPECKVIPYIQANNYLVNYKSAYIHAQIEAIRSLNLGGYLLWNSKNNYWETLEWIKDF